MEGLGQILLSLSEAGRRSLQPAEGPFPSDNPPLRRELCAITQQKGVREGTGPEGGKMRGKGWEERGPKAHSKNSDFGSSVI